MKRFASVLLAVVLMLSLSVFSFASSSIEDSPLYIGVIDIPQAVLDTAFVPYALVPPNSQIYYNTSSNSTSQVYPSSAPVDEDSNGYYIGSGAYKNSNDSWLPFARINYPVLYNYQWCNFIGRLTDANGKVVSPTDITGFAFTLYPGNALHETGYNSGAINADFGTNVFDKSNNFFQIASAFKILASGTGSYSINIGIGGSYVEPFSFEITSYDYYTGESSNSIPPFEVGGIGGIIPDVPDVKDPNDASQYGDAADQVEWYNDAFGGAVDPELDEKIFAGTDMLLQQEEIEQDVIADFQQYSSQVDPANITFPTAVLNGMSFIGTTFMSSYNNLGDISFVISLSMMIGVVLVLIGRGEGALARGMSASSRERRLTEYASERDMKKGG